MSFNLTELLGEKLLSKTGEVDTADALKDVDVLAIYFSAHWCPPCRGFTPAFAEKYTKLKEAGKRFECVFASSDQDETAFKEYFAEMPWLALPYDKRDLKQELSQKYNCNGIPYLVIIDAKTGETITTNGRAGVSGQNFIEDFPYHPKPMYDVSESMDGIADGFSLIVVQDHSDDDVKKKNSEILLNLAKDKKEFGKFFTANGGGPVSFIRTELKLAKVPPKHEHPLVLANDRPTKWRCNGCRKPGQSCKVRNRCNDCDFDLCEICEPESKKEVDEAVKVPTMAILKLKEESYYKPLEGFEEVNEANIMKFMEDVKAESCTKMPLASTE